jgi:hypothetical protein
MLPTLSQSTNMWDGINYHVFHTRILFSRVAGSSYQHINHETSISIITEKCYQPKLINLSLNPKSNCKQIPVTKRRTTFSLQTTLQDNKMFNSQQLHNWDG